MPHQTIGAVQRLLERSDIVRKAIEASYNPTTANWLIGRLAPQLGPLAEARNPAAHSGTTDRETILKVRESVLGIGCDGLIEQIGRAKL